MLAEILHAQDACAVCICIEVTQAVRVADIRLISPCPLRIGENIDIRLVIINLGLFVHLHIVVRHILEVQHPGIQKVLFPFWDQQMGFYHELFIQANEHLCMVHSPPPGVINCVHQNLVQFCGVNPWLTGNPPGRCITPCDGSVIEQQYLGIRLQAKFLSPIYRHVCHNCPWRVLCQLISFLQSVNLHYVVPIESSLNDGACLCKSNLIGPNLCPWVICLCRHCVFSSLNLKTLLL